MGKMQKTVSC